MQGSNSPPNIVLVSSCYLDRFIHVSWDLSDLSTTSSIPCSFAASMRLLGLFTSHYVLFCTRLGAARRCVEPCSRRDWGAQMLHTGTHRAHPFTPTESQARQTGNAKTQTDKRLRKKGTAGPGLLCSTLQRSDNEGGTRAQANRATSNKT